MTKSRKSLKHLVREKFKSNEQKELWWAKFAAVRRRRVWKLSEQQNHRCCYCASVTWVFDGEKSVDHKYYPDRLKGMSKRQMATVDHLTPVSKGGTEHIDNFVMSCCRCNHLRGNMAAMEFWEILQDPAKLKALIRHRTQMKNERGMAKYAKRQSHRNRFVFWLSYFLLMSPAADMIAKAIVTEIERYKQDQDAKQPFFVSDLLAV